MMVSSIDKLIVVQDRLNQDILSCKHCQKSLTTSNVLALKAYFESLMQRRDDLHAEKANLVRRIVNQTNNDFR